jgi:putative aminopeptidase FrvX
MTELKKVPLPAIDTEYMIDFLARLLEIPSPSGYAREAMEMVEQEARRFPELKVEWTKKGSLLLCLPGEKASENGAKRALTAHVDTLGAMVREIKSNGRLELTNIGGFAWGSVEGENCLIHTRNDGVIRGSFLPIEASVHVYDDVRNAKRDNKSMEVRLDERVSSAAEVRSLGIEVGDFVSFDARVELVNGFVKSRHLDDKACVANILAAVKALHDANLKPAEDVVFLTTNYEEVGHGGSSDFPEGLEELIALDMAAIGAGQNSDEYHASICVKDASGPYHHELSNKLRDLADAYEIPVKVDTYVHYSSDAKAYWRAGGSAAVALIGPGVDSSHHYERTHTDALVDTTKWVLAYLLN